MKKGSSNRIYYSNNKMSEDTVKSITEAFKALLIKSQKYVKQNDNALKQYAKIVNASKNIKLKRTSKYLQ